MTARSLSYRRPLSPGPCGANAMLVIPGSPIRTCEGVTRREWLRVGALGSFGLGLPSLLAHKAQGASEPSPRTFGRAKSCIVLFMFGAPAHQDSWDLKPV